MYYGYIFFIKIQFDAIVIIYIFDYQVHFSFSRTISTCLSTIIYGLSALFSTNRFNSVSYSTIVILFYWLRKKLQWICRSRPINIPYKHGAVSRCILFTFVYLSGKFFVFSRPTTRPVRFRRDVAVEALIGRFVALLIETVTFVRKSRSLEGHAKMLQP